MMRGTFSNIRIKNEMLDGIEGGYTCHYPSKKQMSIFDASMKYQKANKSLVIFSGKDYGMGSSRDWAAKGTNLLGVKAVIAESYERIHRSNLVGMGVLPLQFIKGENRKSLKLKGSEIVTITGLDGEITPNMQLPMAIKYASGKTVNTKVNCLIKTVNEVEYLQTGGILQYVLKNLAESA
jgi:aconitate hydratase